MDTTLPRVEIKEADGFVLVTRSRDTRKVVPPYKFFYEHSQHEHLETALDDYNDYESGEYPGREAVAIYPVRKGVPINGGEFSPHTLAAMLKERLAA